ncbi:hypothetical protein EWH08_03725 [Sphingobium indicum]|uniref:Uncharacterized protein n=2 Tax=Sphingobium indicum TaxID=332055 RepID=A0A1L5BLQ3_SPHIB|nr:hypothetical protein SIDU_04525 [Sphingobium indicum B90A]KEY97272.1 hypothetical protein AI27_20130 [Sphingomonas sp. BHC-A]RYM03615.1 hypothetical protein EWH08_03725 [Sphingobium indicum]
MKRPGPFFEPASRLAKFYRRESAGFQRGNREQMLPSVLIFQGMKRDGGFMPFAPFLFIAASRLFPHQSA